MCFLLLKRKILLKKKRGGKGMVTKKNKVMIHQA
jgi:hypothetical protein